ncbi:MAG: SpoIIE family protein phosphatase [Firmicutes bacterium]|nr:SpoIIE family protein phosphatase [Bacillota bacterium]
MEPAPRQPWERQLKMADLRQLRKDLHTLLSILIDISSELNLDELLHKIIHHATELCDGDAGTIALVDGTGSVIKRYPYRAPEILARLETPLGQGALYEAIEKRRTIIVDDYSLYPRRIESFVKAGVKSLIVTPIMRKGKITGVIEILNVAPNKYFTRYQAGLLEAVAGQAAVAIENAEYYEELRKSSEEIKKRSKDLDALLKVALDITAGLNLNDLMYRIARNATELTEADAAAVGLLDESKNIVTYPFIYNLPEVIAKVDVPVNGTMTGIAIQRKEPFIIEDYQQFSGRLEVFANVGLRAIAITPLLLRGRVIGTLWVSTRDPQKKFNERDLTILQGIGRQAAVAIENSRLYEAQRHISESLQRRMLPQHIPPIPNIEVGVRYFSATEEALVGGDFYDLYEVNGRYAFVIGDVSGKGIEAATSTSVLKSILRAYLYQNFSPAHALTQANDFIDRQEERASFITIFCATYDPKTGIITFVNAGHPYPCLLNQIEKTCAVLSTHDPAIGIISKYSYREKTIPMHAGNLFVAYTDGVIEARSGKEFFGEERLVKTLLENLDEPAQEIADTIINAVLSFTHGKLSDDVALLVIRRVA